MGQPVTIDKTAERAYALEREIVTGCAAIRVAWVALAERLHDFHAEQMWETLGHDTFKEWVASPEVDLGYRHVAGLIEAHRELVIERGVKPAALEDIEVSKVREILPALRRGEIDVDRALDDARSLSRSDIRAKYGSSESTGRMETCVDCGRQRRAA